MGFLTEDTLVRYLRKLGLANYYGQLCTKATIIKDAAATQTLTAAMSGTVLRCAIDAVITLPAISGIDMKGVWYKIVNGAASASTGLLIRPNAADGIGGMGLTGVVDKDLTNTPATDVLNDFVVIECTGIPGASDTIGTGGWRIVDVQGIWAKEA